MYPSSTSSSSSSMSHSSSGLTRYGSAPGSFLTTAVESVINANNNNNNNHHDYSGQGSHHSSSHNIGPSRYFQSNLGSSKESLKEQPDNNLERSFGFNDLTMGSGGGGVMGTSSTTPLVRHSSSPARFLNQLAAAAGDTTVSMGRGSYNSKGVGDSSRGITRLNSQLSFTRQEALSQIAEENEDVEGTSTDNGHRKSTHSYATASNFAMGSWEDNNSIMFSVTPSKRAKHISNDIVNGLDEGETQFQFGLSQTALEMASMDRLLHIPEDSVPCKIRAKRGCATHPRSIAERERRTRISGKLKKLQDLVPNMDKQTSYADMLDLAVQHIRTLQDQVQNLNTELENCKCGCKKSSQ
ncbi:transcription factor bHLH128-like isoform X2 [Lycium barbarum]|uniref:transcription factor bHLH128-like isoform X2 n=1 Tax=Lycium barbarum TaxID=112863 RepID=UPI00293F0279|nr:transcription factor bHLH128-like isoform X2 [Lycium barbarum]